MCLQMKTALSRDLWHPATPLQESWFFLNWLSEGSYLHAGTTVSGFLLCGCTPKIWWRLKYFAPHLIYSPSSWCFPSFCQTDPCALQELSPGFAGLCKNLLFEQLQEANISAQNRRALFLGCKFLMKTLGYECVIISLLFFTAWRPVGVC